MMGKVNQTLRFENTKKYGNGFLLGERLSVQPHGIGFRSENQSSNENGQLIYDRSEKHILTAAGTGSGKTRDVIIPNLLNYRGSCVALDIKGELYQATSRRRREMGQRIIRLDPWQLAGEISDRLNPFDIFELGKGVDPDLESQFLADLLCQRTSAKEPFWDLQSKGLISGIISLLMHSRDVENRNIRSLLKLILNEDAVYSLACEMDRSGKNLSEMSRHEIGAFLNLTDITRSGVLATASSYLKILQSRSITGVLEDSTVDLKKLLIGHEPVTIYLIIPPAYVKSHLMLFKVWIHVFLRTFMERKVIPEIPTLLLLDEIAQLGEFPLLENLLTIGRGYGVRVHCVLQNLQQLKQNFPQSWETMIGNCGIHQFFGISDFNTAKQLEAVTGIGAQELLKIGKDEQYLVINGLQTKAERINYLKHPLFKGLYDKNNFYAQKVL